VEADDGTRLKVVTAAGDEFPEGALVGLDFSPRDLNLFELEAKATLCYGVE
jgi:hypothetical protein